MGIQDENSYTLNNKRRSLELASHNHQSSMEAKIIISHSTKNKTKHSSRPVKKSHLSSHQLIIEYNIIINITILCWIKQVTDTSIQGRRTQKHFCGCYWRFLLILFIFVCIFRLYKGMDSFGDLNPGKPLNTPTLVSVI